MFIKRTFSYLYAIKVIALLDNKIGRNLNFVLHLTTSTVIKL